MVDSLDLMGVVSAVVGSHDAHGAEKLDAVDDDVESDNGIVLRIAVGCTGMLSNPFA